MKKLLSIFLFTFMACTVAMAQCEVIDMVINEARQAANKGDKAHAVKLLQNAIDNKSLRDLNCSNYSRLAEEKRRIESQQQASSSSFSSEKTTVNGEPANRFTVNGVTFTMVKVQGGTFQMGATSEDGSAEETALATPAHRVTLSDYYIGQTEVTVALWQAVMGNYPSRYRKLVSDVKGSNNSIQYVSWNDCQQFITKLNQLTGRKFRLPTEAEWEYAARGGSKSRGYKYAGGNDIGSVAWYNGNSGYLNHPVGQKQSNELGLYDMSGNVREWCQDWYGYYSSSAQTNPQGPSSSSYRVLRGGCTYQKAEDCRVWKRSFDSPDKSDNELGLRLAM